MTITRFVTARKYVIYQPDGVGDVRRSAAVDITGAERLGGRTSREDKGNQVDYVGDVYRTIAIDAPADREIGDLPIVVVNLSFQIPPGYEATVGESEVGLSLTFREIDVIGFIPEQCLVFVEDSSDHHQCFTAATGNSIIAAIAPVE